MLEPPLQAEADVSHVDTPDLVVAVQSRDAPVQRDVQIVFTEDQAVGGSLYALTGST